ncbi:MAG TPA: patatin-like phospholipase family protein [Burkholderiales bacterium]
MPEEQPKKRRILSCDGGGMRAMITLHCLKAFELEVGKTCFEYFDMFAGTSGGAEVIGLLAQGTSVDGVIDILTNRRDDMFSRWIIGNYPWPLVTKYRKRPIHLLFKEIYDAKRRLCDLDRDIMICSVDTVRSETAFFTSFRLPGGGRYGTYKDVRLRDAVEASMSAPTFWKAHGRFVDGGIGTYNNPCYAAAVEALRYSSDRENGQPSIYDGAEIEVYSFSAGNVMNAMAPDEAMRTGSLCWLRYLLSAGIDQAGYQQSYVSQSELDFAERAVKFHRYDFYITDEVIQDAWRGCQIKADELAIDAHDDESMELLNKLGEYQARHLKENGFFMGGPSPSPVSASAQSALAKRPAGGNRWDQFGKPPLPANYVQEVMAQFDSVDKLLD